MKTFITTFALCLLTSFLMAQTINDVPLSDIDVEYVQIVGTRKMMSNKVIVRLDFGQNTKYFKQWKETLIKDENGNRVIFNSMIDALNFMNANGYSFKTAYAITIGSQNVYHYLLKKNSI